MAETMPPTRPNTKTVVYGTTDGTTVVPMLVDAAGNLQVDVASTALPTGAATEAKQDDIITALGLQATEAKQDDIITAMSDGSQVTQVVLEGRVRFRDQLTNDAGAEVELTGLTASRWYGLERLHVVHSAGTAANIRPRVYDTTAGAAGAISDIRYEDTTLVATPIDNTFVSPIPCRADADGKLYFRTGVDAGADNTVDYDIILVDLGA